MRMQLYDIAFYHCRVNLKFGILYVWNVSITKFALREHEALLRTLLRRGHCLSSERETSNSFALANP